MKSIRKPMVYTGKLKLNLDAVTGCVSTFNAKHKGDGSIATSKGGK